MFKNVLPTLLLIVSFIIVSAQDDVSQAKWHPTQLTIDGSNSEWAKPFSLYAGSTGLMFSIANDSSALYLCFTGNDEMKMRKMMRAGWKLELSSKEKNKKFSASVTFPVRQMSGFENKTAPKTDWHAHHDFGSLVGSYKMQFTNINAAGFRTKNGILPAYDSSGIRVSIGDDSVQGVIYEISIPLKELYNIPALQLSEQLMLNVTVNAMEAPQGGGSGFHGGEHGGGMGAGNGGGWGGSGQSRGDGGQGRMNHTGEAGEQFGESEEHRSMNMESRSAMFESASFKQKFKLGNH